MNGVEEIREILEEPDNVTNNCETWDNVHSQTWHDAWRNSH